MNLTSDYDDYFCTHITQFFVMGETNAPKSNQHVSYR